MNNNGLRQSITYRHCCILIDQLLQLYSITLNQTDCYEKLENIQICACTISNKNRNIDVHKKTPKKPNRFKTFKLKKKSHSTSLADKLNNGLKKLQLQHQLRTNNQ